MKMKFFESTDVIRNSKGGGYSWQLNCLYFDNNAISTLMNIFSLRDYLLTFTKINNENTGSKRLEMIFKLK